MGRETGLYYYRARYYDAVLGRVLSEDPLEFAAGDQNQLRHTANSPLNEVDPFGLIGRKTVETGVKGITLFIEWIPEANTVELKIIARDRRELAIIKWILDPRTGQVTGEVLEKHGGRRLPGVAKSVLEKILPRLTAEMEKAVAKIGGTWVLTRLAEPVQTNDRLGLQTARNVGKLGFGTIFSAVLYFFAFENTAYAPEPEPPVYLEIDPKTIGLSDEDLLHLSNALDQILAP